MGMSQVLSENELGASELNCACAHALNSKSWATKTIDDAPLVFRYFQGVVGHILNDW